MSDIQAVIFKKRYYNAERARKWLDKHKLIPIKRVDKTQNYLRYRITPPKYKRYAIKKIKGGIKLVLGWK